MEEKRSSVDYLDDIILEPFLNDGYAELHDDLQEFVFDYQEKKLDEQQTDCLINRKINTAKLKEKETENSTLINNNCNTAKYEEGIDNHLRKGKTDFKYTEPKEKRKRENLTNNTHSNNIVNDIKIKKEVTDKNHLRKRKADFGSTVNDCKNRKIQTSYVPKLITKKSEELEMKDRRIKYIFISLKISVIFVLLIIFIYYIYKVKQF